MAKVSEKYEALVVLNTKEGEESVKSLVEKITALISANAAVDSIDEWGKRRLAYPIEDETEGYYVLFGFSADPSFPAELDRVLNITDGVMRSLITLKFEETAAPQKAAEAPAEAPAEPVSE